ncbi:MAG: riboflavin synthase [Gammaproteobacteria bacterium]|nr:riboflavin synthase [Gammaproteobacteria bacterium]
MFTGIVQGLCEVGAVDDEPGLRRLELRLGGELTDGLETGASVAVNGVCLTVTAVEGGDARFDVIRETLSLTNLGDLAPGHLANVERSFRVGDEVGGHILSGHVSGVAEVARVEEAANERNVYFRVPPELMKFLSYKGFVSLDGASLTIAHADAGACEIGVCLIPETIRRTTLGRVTVGSRVNLEVDPQTQTIVETVERVLAERLGA